MHKPITTPDAFAACLTAVGIFSGMMEDGHEPVYTAWAAADIGGGVELFALCAQYGTLSEDVLQDLAKAAQPFNFPGVYDYEVSEVFGQHLRGLILAGNGFEQFEVKLELGRLIHAFFSHDPDFTANPVNAEIIERHTGFKAP